MRLFIAINFPEEIRSEIEKAREELVEKFPQVSWTKKENIHLTLKFLGYIDKDELLKEIKQGIEKSIEGIKPFEVQFEKLGYFEREQLIVWLGAKAAPQLSLLIEKLDKEMGKLGFGKERREFTAHIAIGRGKHLDQKILQSVKQVFDTEQFILPRSFSVSAIHLMNSTLTPKGPIYEEVRSFSLRSLG